MEDSVVSVRLSEGGRILIPAKFRRALCLKDGDLLVLEVDGDSLRLKTRAASIAHAIRVAAPYMNGSSMAEELLAERRAEARAELDD